MMCFEYVKENGNSTQLQNRQLTRLLFYADVTESTQRYNCSSGVSHLEKTNISSA